MTSFRAVKHTTIALARRSLSVFSNKCHREERRPSWLLVTQETPSAATRRSSFSLSTYRPLARLSCGRVGDEGKGRWPRPTARTLLFSKTSPGGGPRHDSYYCRDIVSLRGAAVPRRSNLCLEIKASESSEQEAAPVSSAPARLLVAPLRFATPTASCRGHPDNGLLPA